MLELIGALSVASVDRMVAGRWSNAPPPGSLGVLDDGVVDGRDELVRRDPASNTRLQQELTLLVQGEITPDEFISTVDDSIVENAE